MRTRSVLFAHWNPASQVRTSRVYSRSPWRKISVRLMGPLLSSVPLRQWTFIMLIEQQDPLPLPTRQPRCLCKASRNIVRKMKPLRPHLDLVFLLTLSLLAIPSDWLHAQTGLRGDREPPDVGVLAQRGVGEALAVGRDGDLNILPGSGSHLLQ